MRSIHLWSFKSIALIVKELFSGQKLILKKKRGKKKAKTPQKSKFRVTVFVHCTPPKWDLFKSIAHIVKKLCSGQEITMDGRMDKAATICSLPGVSGRITRAIYLSWLNFLQSLRKVDSSFLLLSTGNNFHLLTFDPVILKSIGFIYWSWPTFIWSFRNVGASVL